MMKLALLLLLSLLFCGPAIAQSVQPTKIRVNNVELHYIEQGQGEPLILLHGGQGGLPLLGTSDEGAVPAISGHLLQPPLPLPEQ
jgi:hypothetical protein